MYIILIVIAEPILPPRKKKENKNTLNYSNLNIIKLKIKKKRNANNAIGNINVEMLRKYPPYLPVKVC